MYRILHIEDLPSDAYLVRREVKKVLDPCEFLVVEARETFLQAFLEFKPDVIISDCNIPGFDWRSALKHTIGHTPRIPFIFVTGSNSKEIRNECLQAGATEFISKDNIEQLGPMILNLLK